ncbi:MAG: SDR family NAD(P)-dependent oxidoreductase, partial [Prochlorothrix sp.]
MTQADRPQDSFPVPLSLKGRTVVITGGTRGIGRMMAEAIAAAGANVVIAGRDGAAVEATVAAVSAVVGLVTQAQAMQELAARELAIQELAAELALSEGTEATAKEGPKLGLGPATAPGSASGLASSLAPALSAPSATEFSTNSDASLATSSDASLDASLATSSDASSD